VILRRDLGELSSRVFDVVVVGGGITGAAVAHDAALRGLRVALVERRDFGAATSAASSKVLHGGIRYLQQFDVGKLRESVFERACFQNLAPHLTRYVPFLIPTFHGLLKGRTALRAAIRLHELLSARLDEAITDPAKRPPHNRMCSKAETLRMAPVLGGQHGLTGSCVIYESHMHSSERMTLAFVKSAAGNGASVANYVAAERLLTRGQSVRGLGVHDERSDGAFEIQARIVVNATGPWTPLLARAFGLPGLERTVTGYSKGVHLVTRPLTNDVALVLPTAKRHVSLIDRGGRHLFVIPWRNRSLVGTSNSPFEAGLDEVRPTPDDVADLLADVNGALPGATVSNVDVTHTFAGLFPLTAETIRPDVYQMSGHYDVIDHGRLGGPDGVISLLSTKYTTARRLAETAVDLVVAKLGGPSRSSRSAATPLVGGAIEDVAHYTADAQRRYASRLDADTVQHLVGHYGTEIDEVLATTTPGVQPDAKLAPDRKCVEAEVVFAVVGEMAEHLDDVVFRRTGLGTIGHPGIPSLERTARIMAGLLDWTAERARAEVERTEGLFPTAAAT
jgi:glycerol-3-phosphate dehydrogenase